MDEIKPPEGMSIKWWHADNNPYMTSREQGTMDHYKVRLRYAGRQLTLPFSKGFGHIGRPPALEEVFECMVQDALCDPDELAEFTTPSQQDALAKGKAGLERLLGCSVEDYLLSDDNNN